MQVQAGAGRGLLRREDPASRDRDSPAPPTHGLLGPGARLTGARALTPPPWQLYGPSLPSARPGEEAPGKAAASRSPGCPDGRARRMQDVGGRPCPRLLLHPGLSVCPRPEAAPTQRGPLSPTDPSARSGHCPAPGGRCTLQCPRRGAFSPRGSGHPAQCEAVFHVPAAAGPGPHECPLLSAELFYLHFLNSLSR